MPDALRISPSLLGAGARACLRATARSLRTLDRARAAALATALAMLVVLLAPWYQVTATAPGADGARHTLRQSLSGWQALSIPAIVSALVAVAAIVWLLGRGAATIDGLGAAGRRTARARLDGGVVAAGGGLASLVEIVGLADHPGPPVALAGATSAASVGVGLALGLMIAVALATLGVRMGLSAGGAPPRLPRRARGSGRPRRRSARGPGPGRPREAAGAHGEEGGMPFDFRLDRRSR